MRVLDDQGVRARAEGAQVRLQELDQAVGDPQGAQRGVEAGAFLGHRQRGERLAGGGHQVPQFGGGREDLDVVPGDGFGAARQRVGEGRPQDRPDGRVGPAQAAVGVHHGEHGRQVERRAGGGASVAPGGADPVVAVFGHGTAAFRAVTGRWGGW